MTDATTPHTPGPWRAVKFKDTKSWSLYASGGSLGNIRDEGDARLTAAAPELLAALKGLCEADRDDLNDSTSAVWNAAAAAIAKATGDAK